LPGRNPSAAYHKFVGVIQQSLGVLTNDVLIVSRGGRHDIDVIHSLTLAGGAILLNEDGLQLSVGMQYAIVRTDKPGYGPYKVSTRAYDYAIRDAQGETLLAYHWHPYGLSSYSGPHLHIHGQDRGLSHKHHMPTGRIALERVIRSCVVELGAEARRDDWDKIVAFNEGRFVLYRSWSDEVPAAISDE